ncbi:MAG: Sec-independent protein translocase subunit TatA/TatB [Chloroflexota bacterium]|nr:MAG: twin-arginine translocase TatA/TatE family subunit [Chloroflexota bacterium]
MLGGHLPELLIVLTLALIVFGPKRLPEIGSSLGKSIRDFRQGVSHLEGDQANHDSSAPTEPRQIEPVVPETKAG